MLDRANRQYLCIASVEGGVEIEEVAKTNPDAVKQIPINPGAGVDAAKAREIATEAKFPEAVFEQAVTMIEALFRVFTEEDATLVEVNPLARLEGDKLEALDGKVSLDDNASEVRHPDHADLQNYLGYAHRNLKQFDAAFRHYKRAIELEPRHRGAHEYIGEAYLMVGDVPNAEKHLAALRAICLLPCEELTDLEKAFAKYRR